MVRRGLETILGHVALPCSNIRPFRATAVCEHKQPFLKYAVLIPLLPKSAKLERAQLARLMFFRVRAFCLQAVAMAAPICDSGGSEHGGALDISASHAHSPVKGLPSAGASKARARPGSEVQERTARSLANGKGNQEHPQLPRKQDEA